MNVTFPVQKEVFKEMPEPRKGSAEANDFAFRKAAERVLERFAEAWERAEAEGGCVTIQIEIDMREQREERPLEQIGRAMRWPWTKKGGRE